MPGPAPAPAAAPSEAPDALRVRVGSFRIDGNTLLPSAVLDAALQRFKGERTADELRSAASAVQTLYAEAGFGAVVAYLPVQNSLDGVVTIQVVEGKLSQVTVEGNRRFTAQNLRQGLPALAVGSTPRLREIDAQIQMNNENPAKQVQVLLQPGAEAGQVLAAISVEERPLSHWTVSADNRGNERTGRTRASLGWQHANVLGNDEVVSLMAQTAPDNLDAVKVISGSLRKPWYAQRVLLDAYVAWSDVDADTTATVAGDLQFNGRGRLAGVRAARLLPRWDGMDQRIALALDYRAYLNTCSIGSFACGPSGESVVVVPVSLEYTLQRGGDTPLALTAGVSHNLPLGGRRAAPAQFEAVRPGADRRFTAWRLSLSTGLALAESWAVQARLAAQWTPDALVPGEQFGIGGASSVRGYEERELAGDRGASLSLELIGPELGPSIGQPTASLRPFGFADAGSVSNRLGTPCRDNRDDCRIASVGLGARWTLGALQAQLAVARALAAGFNTDKGDTNFHVSLSFSF